MSLDQPQAYWLFFRRTEQPTKAPQGLPLLLMIILSSLLIDLRKAENFGLCE